MAPPVRLMELEPATAVTVPPQSLLTPLGLATVRPAGKVSVKATPVSVTLGFGSLLGFTIVKLTDTVVFCPAALAENDFVMVGGVAALTVIDAVEVFPVPPSVEVACTLLTFTPIVVPVTLTENVHDALDARLAPDKLTEDAPGVAVIVPPPQVPVKPLGVATTRPDGRLSVNATPVSVTLVLEF